ncbi:MAG: hypothetical protein V1809_03425 [Planctomycetota bacterium]
MADVNPESLYPYTWREAEKHKWIESEKAGRDLGDPAIRDWEELYLWRFSKERWLEHISGRRFWLEYDPNYYGLLNRMFHPDALLVERIVDRFKSGAENLDIILWACDWKIPEKDVLDILQVININSCRLPGVRKQP